MVIYFIGNEENRFRIPTGPLDKTVFSWYNREKKMIEMCPYCNSVNHIFVDNPYADAWECWACFTKSWIDEESEKEYMAIMSVDSKEANDRMQRGDYTVQFLLGFSNEQV